MPQDDMKLVTIKRVPVFRAGDYGEKGKYAPEDIAAMAARYAPETSEAPVTVDHVLQYRHERAVGQAAVDAVGDVPAGDDGGPARVNVIVHRVNVAGERVRHRREVGL